MCLIILKDHLDYVNRFYLFCNFLLTHWTNCSLQCVLPSFILFLLIYLWLLLKIMQRYNSCIIIYSVGVCAKNKYAIETLSAVCFGSVLLLPRHHYFSTCVVLAICKGKKKRWNERGRNKLQEWRSKPWKVRESNQQLLSVKYKCLKWNVRLKSQGTERIKTITT